jgi:hypothetical protein
LLYLAFAFFAALREAKELPEFGMNRDVNKEEKKQEQKIKDLEQLASTPNPIVTTTMLRPYRCVTLVIIHLWWHL